MMAPRHEVARFGVAFLLLVAGAMLALVLMNGCDRASPAAPKTAGVVFVGPPPLSCDPLCPRPDSARRAVAKPGHGR